MSYCRPSLISSSVSKPFDVSTLITPSRPTLSIASAIISPTSLLPAEIVATEAISFPVSTLRDFSKMCFAISLLAISIPSRIKTGFAPFSTAFKPFSIMLCARIVAVVVPSPAVSFVLLATSYTSFAPIFSNLSSSSISFAMETPSFVISGEPYSFSNTTLRPFGPKVTRTASAKILTPFSIDSRASFEKRTSFAIIDSSLRNYCQNIFIGNYNIFFIIHFYACTRIFFIHYFVAYLVPGIFAAISNGLYDTNTWFIFIFTCQNDAACCLIFDFFFFQYYIVM